MYNFLVMLCKYRFMHAMQKRCYFCALTCFQVYNQTNFLIRLPIDFSSIPAYLVPVMSCVFSRYLILLNINSSICGTIFEYWKSILYDKKKTPGYLLYSRNNLSSARLQAGSEDLSAVLLLSMDSPEKGPVKPQLFLSPTAKQ